MTNWFKGLDTKWKIVILAVGALFILGILGSILEEPESERAPMSRQPDSNVNSAPRPTSIPAPTATLEHKFSCRDLELEFNSMSALGYENALQHVSNVMSLKDDASFTFYTLGDAERELRACGVIL